MYLIAALKVGRPRYDAAIWLASSERLSAALSCGRRQERKKKKVKFEFLGMKVGRKSVKALANLFPYHACNI